MTTVEEITLLADRCTQTDYADQTSVKAHNLAADRIRELIAAISNEDEHFALLRGPNTKSWAAFQVLEGIEQPTSKLHLAACEVLRLIANSGGPKGLAAEWRLKGLREGS